MTMKLVNIFEAKAQLSDLLDAAVAGERVVICKRNQPVAELTPVKAPRTTQRALGLAPGAARMAAGFFDPLPEAVLRSFEVPGRDPDAMLGATHVAEPRGGPGHRKAVRRPRTRR